MPEEETAKRASKGSVGPVKKKVKEELSYNAEYKYDDDHHHELNEVPLEGIEGALTYKPVYFLRTHSKNNDPADVQTQIWQCAFEPDPLKPGDYTNIVATCGGSSVCFINVETGEVVLKYNKNTKVSAAENFYAIAWSTLTIESVGIEHMNILAAGGGRSTVVLLHPEQGFCYQIFRAVSTKPSSGINTLLFHPKKATWLFCGYEDGSIQLWDIGIPTLPDYECTPVNVFTIHGLKTDVYNLVFSQTHNLLIGGHDSGITAWEIDIKKIKKDNKLQKTEFKINKISKNENIVDSICLVRDDILAFKCALHGLICLFRLSKALEKAEFNSINDQKEVAVEQMLLKFKWSDTDNYYMNMGVDASKKFIIS